MKNKKMIIILIVALVIGFAGISTTLIIQGALKFGFNSDDFDVIFTEAKINGTGSSAVISEDKKTITFSTSKLTSMDESSILDYKVMNQSTQYNAEATINCTTEETEYIGVVNELGGDIIGLNYKTVLGALEERSGVITAKLIKPYSGEDRSITITCVIDVKPTDEETTKPTTQPSDVTSSTTTQAEDEIEYNLTINPNGGSYNGSTEIINTKVVKNTEVTLNEVTKESYIFSHWQVNGEENLSGNTITITKDTTLKAIWISEGDVVARIDETYYSSVQKAFDAANTNDEVVLLKDTEEVATNSKNVFLNLDSHKITGKIINNGQIKIDNGTIENPDGSAVVNSGDLILGEQDKKVSITSPSISGANYGIEQNGTFSFYDGVIEGIVGVTGDYTELEYNHHAFVDHNYEKDCQKVYLEENNGKGVVKTTINGDVYYLNLQDAINTSSITSYPIYAVRDFEATYKLHISKDANIVFDIQGYNVETGNTFINEGTLTLKDSTTKTGSLLVSMEIKNNGTLNIKDLIMTQTTDDNLVTSSNNLNIKNSTLTSKLANTVTLTNNSTFSIDEDTSLLSDKFSLYLSTATTTIDKGTIKSIYVGSGSNLTIDGGNIMNSLNRSAIRNEGSVTINGGNITGRDYDGLIYTENSAKLVITGGLINGSGKAISMNSGIFEMTGGEIIASNCININNTKYTISGGTLKPSAYSMVVSNGTGTIENVDIYGNGIKMSGTLTINNINFLDSGDVGIDVSGSSTNLTINGGTIKGEYAIQSSNGNTYINGGNIIGSIYGININNSSAIVTIGTDDDNTKDTPIILGENYGIYGVGTLNYNGGIVKGTVAPIETTYLKAFSVLDTYKIKETTEVINEKTYIVNSLEKQLGFLKVNDQTFDTLSKAIEVIEEEGNIEMIDDGNMGSQVVIPANKKITLDLNGHTLTFTEAIYNLGSLKIIDSSQTKTGTLNGINSARMFGNQKELSLEGIKINSSASDYIIYSTLKDSSITIIDTDITQASTYTAISITNGSFTMHGGSIEKDVLQNSNQSILNLSICSYDIDNVNFNLKDNNTVNINNNNYALDLSSSNGTIKNSNVTSDKNGIKSYGTLTLTDTNINSNIVGLYTGTKAVVSNCDIKGKTGIAVYDSETTINSGTITGTEYGINAILRSSTYKLNIGNADSDNLEVPIIIGEKYGIYQNEEQYSFGGSVNFYSGVIKGVEGALSKSYSAIRDGYLIKEEIELISDKSYTVNSLEKKASFLRVGDQTFNSLDDAIAYIESEDTIVLTANGENSTEIAIPSDKNITIDLNGYTLSTSKTITNNGVLIINDNSLEKKGKIITSNNSERLFNNSRYCRLSINNIAIENYSSNMVIYNYSGILELNNVSIYSDVNYAVINNSGASSKYTATLIMTGGEIRSSASQVITATNSEVTINGSKIIQENSTPVSNTYAVALSGSGTIEGLDVVSDSGVSIVGDFTANNISSSSSNIALIAGGTVNLNNANLQGRIGLRVTGICYVKKGTIFGTEYGIYNIGTTYIGTDGENIQRNLFIKGDLYGVYRENGKVYFYDGVIGGITEPIFGGYDGVATNKSINENEEEIDGNLYKINTLKPIAAAFKNGSNTYNDLSTALSDANNGDTIELLESAQVYQSITIPGNKEIILDLNGNNLTFIDTFINNGQLDIINSSLDFDSNIKMLRAKNLIENKGVLNVTNVELISDTSNYVINTASGARTSINNSKILGMRPLINAGYLESNTSEVTSKNSTFLENSGEAILNDSIFRSSVSLKNRIINQGSLIVDGGSVESIDQYGKQTSYSSVIRNATVFSITVSAGSSSVDNTTIDTSFFTIPEIQVTNCNFVNSSGSAFRTGPNTTATLSNNNFNLVLSSTYSSPSYIQNAGTLNLADTTISFVDDRPTDSMATSSIIDNTGNLRIDNMDFSITTLREEFKESVKSYQRPLQRETQSIRGLSNSKTGYAILNNFNLKATDSYEIYGLSISGGAVEIPYSENPTTIEVSGMENAGYVYGVYINGGTFVMGSKDESETSGTADSSVFTDNPTIKAISSNAVGIGVKKDNGMFNFYDGKVIGSASAIPDTISSTEPYYEARPYYDKDNYQYKILEYMG